MSGVVNTYQKVSAVSGTTVTVAGATRGAANPFAVGDHVMLVQMTGVAPVQTGSNMGNYDNTTITAISGSNITLAAVARTYSPAAEMVQLVRAYYATGTTTVSATLTAAPWNGTTGGVVALQGDDLVLSANIDASATGFTSANQPTAAMTTSLSSGSGSTTGRGSKGGEWSNPPTSALGDHGLGGAGGGGLGGGGGVNPATGLGSGGGRGGAGQTTYSDPWGFGVAAPGSNGGNAFWPPQHADYGYGGAQGPAGGGGGVIGGGGGGGGGGTGDTTGSGGGGGGTDGGGGGGELRPVATQPTMPTSASAGGGGPLGVGNGGDGLPGSPKTATDSNHEGSAGAGGGSYGGGGGAPSNFSGADDSIGGGGGGSWTGGGAGGVGGVNLNAPSLRYPSGGAGNVAVAGAIPDSAHYLNSTNPRLMMGGAGGVGSQDAGSSPGGAGGGIVFIDFKTISGGSAIRSDGGAGATPAGGGGHSGSGGGGGGQMRIRAYTISAPLVLGAKGGVGGTPTANTFHAGASGAGGGAGGIWLEVAGASASCPAAAVPNVTFQLTGGNGGPSITNPKNGYPTGTGGAGGSGLACVTPNNPPPKLTLVKALGGARVGSADQFRMEIRQGSVNGTVVGSTGSSTTTGSGSGITPGTGTTTIDPATAATTYYLVEVGTGGADLAQYDVTISCVDTAGVMAGPFPQGGVTGTVAAPGSAPWTPSGYALTPVVGAAIVCTLTNSPKAAVLTYAKTSVPAAGTAVQAGDTVTYSVTVSNATGTAATTGTVTDNMSGVVDGADLTTAPTLACSPTANTCGALSYTPGASSFVWHATSADPMAANTVATITYSVRVTATATGRLHNVLVEPNISVDHPIIDSGKVVDKGDGTVVDPGDTLTYTVNIENTGTVDSLPFSRFDDLTDVVDKADFLPGSIAIVPAGRGAAAYDAATKHLTWTGSLQGGQSVQVSYQVKVKADAHGTLRNHFIDTTVVNPVSAGLKWRKVDTSGGPLAGAEWTLTAVDGSGQPTGPTMNVPDCRGIPCAGRDTDPVGGQFLVVGLAPGSYRLIETKAPVGYVLNPSPISIVVATSTQITVGPDVTNDRQHAPTLPLAGGIGSDDFRFGGFGILAIAVGLAAWQRRRRAL
ncbi:SpaA isopeptide-forming pilin-related protein [Aquihabitans sp. McL0605]|uniref:DUF7927 domain-containing protein n=1 Tax=Aquihabitans sp. McL0605 TaxID=3415671 RepID=UPI003CF48630